MRCVCEGGGGGGGEGGSGVRGVQIQVRTQKIYKYFLKCVSCPLYSPLCDKCS